MTIPLAAVYYLRQKQILLSIASTNKQTVNKQRVSVAARNQEPPTLEMARASQEKNIELKFIYSSFAGTAALLAPWTCTGGWWI